MKRDSPFSIAAVLLLALMAALAGGAALRQSVTVDEVAHIGAGVSYWQKLDMRLNPEHPPLTKLLAGLPLAILGTRADYSSIQWTASSQPFQSFLGEWIFGDWLLFRWNEPVKTLAWARLPMLLLTLALGWTIFVLGRRLGGPWGGLLSLIVYVGMPAFIAFGPLVHTDIAIALFSLLSIWTFADLYEEPTRKRKWIFAVCFACALLSKFTAGILLFVFAAFILSARWFPLPGQPAQPDEAKAWRKIRRRALIGGVFRAALIVYVVYAVFTWNQPTWVLDHLPGGAVMAPVRRLLMPAWEYLVGALLVVVTSSRPTFILGQWYSHGVWFYFPVVLVLKSPLGFLALLALGVPTWRVTKRYLGGQIAAIASGERLHWRALCVSLLVWTAICVLSRMSISIRHFSVPLALLILLLSPIPATLQRLRTSRPGMARMLQASVAVAAVSCIIASLLAYPYYFPFMNILTAGRPAFTLVSDSNVDWNQSLPEAKRFAEERGIHRLPIDAYGFTDPAYTIPNARMWNCQTPEQGDAGQLVVVSANLILDSHNCPWLMKLPREEIAGGSMYAIQLPPTIPPAGTVGGPPLPSKFRQVGGLEVERDLRAMFLNLSRHPEGIPVATLEFQREFEKYREKQKGK